MGRSFRPFAASPSAGNYLLDWAVRQPDGLPADAPSPPAPGRRRRHADADRWERAFSRWLKRWVGNSRRSRR